MKLWSVYVHQPVFYYPSQNSALLDGVTYTFLVLHVLLVIVWIVGFIVVLIKFTKAGIKVRAMPYRLPKLFN